MNKIELDFKKEAMRAVSKIGGFKFLLKVYAQLISSGSLGSNGYESLTESKLINMIDLAMQIEVAKKDNNRSEVTRLEAELELEAVSLNVASAQGRANVTKLIRKLVPDFTFSIDKKKRNPFL